MLRLPTFTYRQPESVDEALRMKQDAGPSGMYVAGGTDLYPNMKRRHQEPATVISLARVPGLANIDDGGDHRGLSIGAGATLTTVHSHPVVRRQYEAVARSAELVSTPLLRNMGTIGGNICLDTRCNYYNQSYEWRKAIDFCMKKDGDICWVAPSSPRCWAVNSSDTAPVMVALAATFVLDGPAGERIVPAARFFQNDGINYLTKHPDEILTRILLPEPNGWDATYWKLRRRGSFDFPVLGVAAWVQWSGDTVSAARIVLGAVASYPQEVPEAARAVIGTSLHDEAITRAATHAFKPSKPMDNTDYALAWRKEMTRNYVRGALEELRARRQRL